jgi:hypothetical protein
MIDNQMAAAEIDGELPDKRVKDSKSAWTICQQLLLEDDTAAQDRAVIDGLIDGKAPYNQADLDEAGQSERININPKDAAALEEQATRAYYDLLVSVDILATVECVYGDSIQRPVWSTGIAEEFTRTLREWNLLNLRVSNAHLQYVRHGVCMAFFEDEVDWRPRTCGLSDFKVRRSTPAAEDECDVAMVRVPITVTRLWQFIRDEETAGEDGWSVEQAKEIVLKHCNGVQVTNNQAQYHNWELLERQIKENDLYYGGNDYHIWVHHLWVKEFDDTVTHIIIPQVENTCSEFLYENRSRYENIHQAFTIFTYGVGDGTYHSIRGMGWKIFDQEQAYARLWNTAMDGAMGNAVTMLQPTTGANTDITKCALSFNGPFAIIPGGYQVVPRTFPDYNRTIGPVINELKSQIRNNTITYQTAPSTQLAEDMPQKSYAAISQQEMSLSESALDLWYAPWGRLIKEIFRRMQDRHLGPEDPGFKEVNAMKKRIKERGIPLEAFYTARNTQPVRAVGSGSKAARLAAYDQAIAYGGSTDEEGRYNLVRDRNALVLGHDQIDRYFKPTQMQGATRFSQDQKNSEFENINFKGFNTQVVSPSDNHSIHCASHSGIIQAVMEMASEGGDPNIEDLEYKYKFLATATPHLGEHNQFLAQDPARKEESKMYAKVIQNAMAMATRAKDELVAFSKQQQEAADAEQQRMMDAEQARIAELEKKAAAADAGGDSKESMKLQREIMNHEFKLRMQEQESQHKRKLAEQEAKQKLAFKDADTAMKFLSMANKTPYED